MKKTAWFALCTGMVLSVGFTSCKKEPEKTTSYHVFWFDKTTSDSLKANGIERISVRPVSTYVFQSGDRFPVTISSDQWYTAPPAIPTDPNDQTVLRIGMDVTCAENRVVEYMTAQMTENDHWVIPLDRLNYSSGVLTFSSGNQGVFHQLIWQ